MPGANLLDWPITLAEMEPWYAKAEDKMGTTRTNNIPGLPGNNNYKVLEAGAKKVGYKEVSTGRMSINSQPRNGRGSCLQIGFCFQGCKSGAKWSTLYAEIPDGELTGNLEVRPDPQALTITPMTRARSMVWSMPARTATTSRRPASSASPEIRWRVRACCSTRVREVS